MSVKKQNQHQEILCKHTRLTDYLRQCTEADCKKLITQEIKDGGREAVIKRIQGRYNKLRSEREMASYMERLAKIQKKAS